MNIKRCITASALLIACAMIAGCESRDYDNTPGNSTVNTAPRTTPPAPPPTTTPAPNSTNDTYPTEPGATTPR